MDNYEEKYKKALRWIQGLYQGLHGKTKEEAEEAFPELKEESEDDKMRNWIINYLNNKDLNSSIVAEKVSIKNAIAWLRGQSKVSVENDLQSEIGNLSKRYPEISFAKLSRIAVHITNWQKQQIAKDNMLLPFKEYDTLMDSINRRKKEGYEAGYKQGLVDSKSEQKPWSEEDERMLENTIGLIEVLDRETRNAYTTKEYIDWLKSLKDRVQPQPMQEWNGGDDAHIHSIITHLEDFIESHPNTTGADIQGENVAWLKSLRPQKQWKPSKEQLQALRWVCNRTFIAQEPQKESALEYLYERLKAL